MTTIKVICSWCHDEPSLPGSAVELLLAADCSSASYRFACPACRAVTVKPASGRVAELLLLEADEVRILGCAPAFNSGSIEGLMADELAELRCELADPDAVTKLTEPRE